MYYKASNIYVPPWGFRVDFPIGFSKTPVIKLSVDALSKTIDYTNESSNGFNIMIFDRNNKGVGGLANYTATDENT